MNFITGGIGFVTASLLGRLSLSLIIVAGATAANARIVKPVADAAIAPATYEFPAYRRGEINGEARLLRTAADARTALADGAASAARELPVERIDEVALLSAATLQASPFVETRLVSLPAPFEAQAPAAHASYGLPLPEPDGWTAVAATIALALFFFLRRLS